MKEIQLTDVEGVRFVPESGGVVGALVIAGSSGRVDAERARLLAESGACAESIRWFGGKDQHDGPWEIALELFLDRITRLRQSCDRVIVLGTSFGSEAALLVGALSSEVDTVVAFAPSDVVWAGVAPAGHVTSHWTFQGVPLPFVPFVEDWEPEEDPPAYVDLYLRSRQRFADEIEAASIPVERIRQLILVAGGDDKVWPALMQSETIRDRRSEHGLTTTIVTDPEAGHRPMLPGEPAVTAGMRMQRGGTEDADQRLGRLAWTHVSSLL